jgi:hypothetical protein
MSKKISKEDFFKSLEKLDQLAVRSQDDLNKAQICTGPNSEVKTWPGGESEEQGEPTVPAGGTDYQAKTAMRKAVAEKVLKGLPLSKADVDFLKEDMKDKDDKKDEEGSKMAKATVKKADEEDDDDEDMEDTSKSLNKAIQENAKLQKGLEVSEFLAEFAKSFSIGLQGTEARLTQLVKGLVKHSVDEQVLKSVQEMSEEQSKFNKSIAEAITNIGYGVAGAIDNVENLAQAPARAPKSIQSTQNVKVLNKSFDGADGMENMSKSQILGAMEDLVMKGKINSLELIKYETTETINPSTMEMISRSARN